MAFSNLQNCATLTSSILEHVGNPPKPSHQLVVILHFPAPSHQATLIYLASPAFHLDVEVEEKDMGAGSAACCS